MAENSAFAASGESAISSKIELQDEDVPTDLSLEDFEEFYDIDRTVREIINGNYKRIALQFPDELLNHSVPIFRRLKSRIGEGRELYVCCVDEVAAQHVDADAMVHYGHACMSQTSRLPVIYVFGKKDVDPSHCATSLLESMNASSSDRTKGTIPLRCDVAYAHRADVIAEKLRAALVPSAEFLYSPIPLFSSPVSLQQPANAEDVAHGIGKPQSLDVPLEDCTLLYVGGESLSLTNLIMTHASCDVHSYDPKTKAARLESARTNKLLMRRYAVVQRARDADVFGILVGTLGVANYLPLITHLRTILSRAHKKSYTISVGKLNPAKLANFLEIECFVLVACPENSLIEAKEFLQPIVTPYELEIALQVEQSWTGRYVLNFDQVLAMHHNTTGSSSPKTRMLPVCEFVFLSQIKALRRYLSQRIWTNRSFRLSQENRHAKRYGMGETAQNDDKNNSSAIVLRNQESTVATLSDSAAAQFLQSRTFRGLETRIGEDAPSILEQGRSGIARGYEDDHPGAT
ncbi:Diphthamide biosynthesis protein 2 [Grifola frondosa]|uniref:2-(3-amino-3-carboxypropyl)histidine synthase subunit 2 n=1 Tax=Grifola frondosa TaxID=5627 RepID=A0A1C7M8N1_GRIFR|nr:Diphthamide biosynthesis protein 2 [Grifola frondosa]